MCIVDFLTSPHDTHENDDKTKTKMMMIKIEICNRVAIEIFLLCQINPSQPYRFNDKVNSEYYDMIQRCLNRKTNKKKCPNVTMTLVHTKHSIRSIV